MKYIILKEQTYCLDNFKAVYVYCHNECLQGEGKTMLLEPEVRIDEETLTIFLDYPNYVKIVGEFNAFLASDKKVFDTIQIWKKCIG